MRQLFHWKWLVVVIALSMLSLTSLSTALATSGTGSQNPDLIVFVSLTPDQATVGTTVTERDTVTNNTSGKQAVMVTDTLVYPNGQTDTRTKKVTVNPGQTVTHTLTYTVDASYQKGSYTLTVSATNPNGTSSATASIVIS